MRIVDLEEYRREYDFVCEAYQRLQGTYSPKPPISESQAMDTALERFEFDISKGIDITANLSYVMFLKSPTQSEFTFLHEAIADAADYRPREIRHDDDCITFRYVWAVAVSEIEAGPGPVETITRHGEYFIDASTGEVILPREPLNHISLRGVSLETKSVYPTPYLVALVFVNASVQLSILELYINDIYLESMVCTNNMTDYTILYKATVTSQNVSIISGETYKVTFVATFRDGTTSNATALVVAV